TRSIVQFPKMMTRLSSSIRKEQVDLCVFGPAVIKPRARSWPLLDSDVSPKEFSMRWIFGRIVFVALFVPLVRAYSSRAADEYSVDPVHSSVSFKASHLGLSWVHGRFNDVSGSFSIDSDNPTKCSFTLTIKTESVDTNNKQRDGHLRAPDFFNAKQF